MHGLRLQNDLGTKVLFVVLSILALLLLSAIVASPARADLTGGAGGGDQVPEAADTTTASFTDDGATVEDEGAPGGEETITAPADQVVEEEISPVGDEVVEVSENILSVGDDVIEVAMAPLLEEGVLDGTEALLSPEDLLTEDLSTVDALSPLFEVVEDVSPFVEIADEVRTVLADVVVMVPPDVVDVVRVLPLFVSPTISNPGPIEHPTVAAIPTISVAHESVLASPPVDARAQQLSGLFAKELVAEMTLFHLTDLTVGSSAGGSSASRVPERETAAMAAYVPVAGTMPVVGGAGASSSTGSSHAGSSSFGGVDAFSFFAAMAALLALCLLGWIRDRARYGRSIFPSHGGRPG